MEVGIRGTHLEGNAPGVLYLHALFPTYWTDILMSWGVLSLASVSQ